MRWSHCILFLYLFSLIFVVILPAYSIPATPEPLKDELRRRDGETARIRLSNFGETILFKRGPGSQPGSPSRSGRMTVAEHNNHIHQAGYHFATSDGKPPNGQNKHPYVPKSKPSPAPAQQHKSPDRLPTRTEKDLHPLERRPQAMLYAGNSKHEPTRIVMKPAGGGVAPAKPQSRTQGVMNKVSNGLKKIGNAISGRKH